MGLEVRGLTKRYGGVTVLSGVDLTVGDGEIHALLGANGAGKSTLIKCVSGAVTPDSGSIRVGDHEVRSHSPRSARAAGVAVIYQDFSVASSLNVTENVFLGQELRRGPFVRRREQRRLTRDWLARLGADLDLDAGVSLLSGAGLQLVEIMKALAAEPRVLILDEPTAALTAEEAATLADQCRRLRDTGLAIVYVTHRLGEVFDLADRVTVLRGGDVALTADVADTTPAQLVDTIAGRTVHTGTAEPTAGTGPAVLQIQGLMSAGIGPIDLEARAGEVVGVYGLLGSGRTELLETVLGAQARSGGVVRIDGRPVRYRRPAEAVADGVALVPSDRLRKGVFLTLPGADNVLLPTYRRLSRLRLLRRRASEGATFAALARRLALHPLTGAIPGRSYSGGNQQKLVVGRWLSTECRVLLLDEPTQGVDVGARSDLYASLRAVAAGGSAVVVASSEPDELRQLADRVVVLTRGRVAAELPGAEVTEARLLALSHQGEDDAGSDGARRREGD